MIAVMNGYVLSMVTGRQLVVDWTDPLFSNDGSNAFNRFFTGPYGALPDDVLLCNSVFPELWRGNLHKTAMQLVHEHFPDEAGVPSSATRTSCGPDNVATDHRVVVFWTFTDRLPKLRHRFADELADWKLLTDFQVLRRLAQQLFVPTTEIRSRIESFKAESFGDETIGVHIRHTDRRDPLHKFHRALKRVLTRRPNAVIFLATDNEAVEAEFRQSYPRVVCRKKQFSSNGAAIHMDLDGGDRTERAIDALTEMYLLSECDHLVYARWSTFSYLSHLLSNLGDGAFTDVDRFNPIFHAKRLVQRHMAVGPTLSRLRELLHGEWR